jgi:2-(1,2-epoxy-1,2-dihydrophenyl)acetyl-CoA isomerase
MLMQHAASTDFNTHLALEASTQKSCAESDDYSEGVEAFLQKRAAKFTGS